MWQYRGQQLWQSMCHPSARAILGHVLPPCCLLGSGAAVGTVLGLRPYLVADGFVLESWLVQDHLQLSAVEIGYSNRLCQACIFACFHSLQRQQRLVGVPNIGFVPCSTCFREVEASQFLRLLENPCSSRASCSVNTRDGASPLFKLHSHVDPLFRPNTNVFLWG